MSLSGKKVLLGVTAGIAAYKSAALVRAFVKAGASVQVVMTPAAKDFVTPLTLSTLSKNPVHSLFTTELAIIYCLRPISVPNVPCILPRPWIWICTSIPLPK